MALVVTHDEEDFMYPMLMILTTTTATTITKTSGLDDDDDDSHFSSGLLFISNHEINSSSTSLSSDVGDFYYDPNRLDDSAGTFLLFDMNTLREVVFLTQTYNSAFLSSNAAAAAEGQEPGDLLLINNTNNNNNLTIISNNNDDGPAFQASMVAAVLEKTRRKILRETFPVSILASLALTAIFFTLVALLLGRRHRQHQPGHLATRRYSMVVSLLCSNLLIASRFFGIPVTIWTAEARSLWDKPGVVCAEKMFESAFYAGNISEMLTLCVLAVYHFCYIVPGWPQVNKIRRYISAKYSLAGVWLLSLLLGFADFYVVAFLTADYYHQQQWDASCEQLASGPRFCMTVSCFDSITQRAWWCVGLVSLVIMTVCYGTIFFRIFQATPLPETQHVVNSPSNMTIFCRKRGLVTTVLIFLSFVLCSVPYSITEVFLKLTRPNPAEQSNRDLMSLIKLISYLQLLILLNCFLDTIIYVVRMPEVKSGYAGLIYNILMAPVKFCRALRHCWLYWRYYRRRERRRRYLEQEMIAMQPRLQQRMLAIRSLQLQQQQQQQQQLANNNQAHNNNSDEGASPDDNFQSLPLQCAGNTNPKLFSIP